MNRSRGVLRATFSSLCLCLSACGTKTQDSGPASTDGPGLPAIPGHASLAAFASTPGPARAPLARAEVVFSNRRGGVARVVEKDGRFQVVHNGRAGKPYVAVGEVSLSRDGRRCAYGAVVGGKWRMVVDGKEGAPFDTVSTPAFSPDGSHVVYQANVEDRWHLVVDQTVRAGSRTQYLVHEFSADSSRLAFVDDLDDQGRGRLVVSDLGFTRPTVVDSGVSTVIMNADGSHLAAVAATGVKQRVVTLRLDQPAAAQRGATYDAVSGLAFGPEGTSLAYLAERSGARLVVLNGEEASVGAGHVIGSPVVVPGRRAVGVLMASLSGSVVLREFFAEDGPREPSYEEAEDLVYSHDGRLRAYAARRGAGWFVVLNGKEGPPFDRVVSPVFSADGRLLAYRARKAGKRFAVVADARTGVVTLHGAHEQVFPLQFTVGGRSIAYGVKDGERVAWKVEAL